MKNKKFGFFLMTKKGFSVLNSLILNNKLEYIQFVCIGIDSQVKNDYSKEIESLCKTNKIEFFYNKKEYTTINNCDYYIAISWRWILNISNLIIFHDSLLPKYRGFAPLVNMLINGEKEIGVTAILASKVYDQGPILAQEKINIEYPIKIETAIGIVSQLYIQITNTIVDKCLNGSLQPIIQNENEATYSLWLDNKDYFLDWNWSAIKLKRKIDACGYPYDGAKAIFEDQIITIESVEIENDIEIENRVPGKVVFVNEGFPTVVCGKGLLKIKSAFKQKDNVSILPFTKLRVRFL